MNFRRFRFLRHAWASLWPPKDIGLEQRVFQFTTFVVGCFCILIFTPLNFLQGLPALHHAAVIGAGLLSIGMWIRARSGLSASPFIYILVNQVLLDLMYFTSAGSIGSLVWILPLALIFAFILLRGWQRVCMVFLYSINLPFLFLAELYFPEWVTGYFDQWARLIDLLTSVPLATLLTGSLMAAVSHSLDDERRRSNEQARQLRDLVRETGRLAMTDGLTELLNQRALRQRLREEMAEAVRYGQTLSLLIMDLDNFKDVNDRYGHQAGDAAICRVADYIRESIRVDDVAGRYGGEEFMLILPHIHANGANVLAEKIRRRVEAAERHGATPFTLSVGVAERCGEIDEEALFRRADRALYQAKQLGRNRVVVDECPEHSATAIDWAGNPS